MKKTLLFICIISLSAKALAQTPKESASDSIMITVFLKHQQDKGLTEIQKKQEENKLWDMFPPKQSRVVSWYVMMGIGQAVTLKITPKDLRRLIFLKVLAKFHLFFKLRPTFEACRRAGIF